MSAIEEVVYGNETWQEKAKREMQKQTYEEDGFIWDNDKLIQNKVFPMDIIDNKLSFGLLLPKNSDNIDRAGKNLGKKQSLFPCILADRKLLEINETRKQELKINFETMPLYLPYRWDLNDIKRYLDNLDEAVDKKELLKQIASVYENYLFIRNPTWYKIHTLWDIGTYLYQIFEAYPLLELRGISGTGKTKSMTISSFISFNGGNIMVNPSEATLFRETEEIRGAKYFDEAEKLWVFNKATNQYEGDIRTELINASYTKEAKVPRQEKIGMGNKYTTKWYSPYSPTQLSSINGLFGATETRAITRICTKSPNSNDKGEREPTEDRSLPIWVETRDKCYRFALNNWKEIKGIYNDFPKDCGLKRRDLQIWKPLLAIAKFISEEDYQEILSFAIELSEMKLDEILAESSFDYMCLSALKQAITSYGSDKQRLDRIKDIFCTQKGDIGNKNDIYLNRNIGQHLKKLGFEKKRDNQGTYIIADRNIFDEIVAPICPQLAFLSTSSTLSSLNKRNEIKKGVDGVKISEDKLISNNEKGVDSASNVDGVAVSRVEEEAENIDFSELNQEFKDG